MTALGKIMLAMLIGLALVFFPLIIAGIVFLALASFVLSWALGVPITVKKNGFEVGFIKWFTFYPARRTTSAWWG